MGQQCQKQFIFHGSKLLVNRKIKLLVTISLLGDLTVVWTEPTHTELVPTELCHLSNTAFQLTAYLLKPNLLLVSLSTQKYSILYPFVKKATGRPEIKMFNSFSNQKKEISTS